MVELNNSIIQFIQPRMLTVAKNAFYDTDFRASRIREEYTEDYFNNAPRKEKALMQMIRKILISAII